MNSKARFLPWSVAGLLGLVQCTYVTGEKEGSSEGSPEELGGAAGEEASGGSTMTGSGGDALDAAGGNPNEGGLPHQEQTGGAPGAGGNASSGGAQESSGGAGSGGEAASGGAGSGGEAASGGAPPMVPAHVVVMTKTAAFRHESAIVAGLGAIAAMMAAEDVELTTTEDSTFFTDDNLEDVGAIVFLNTSGDIFTTAQELAFERFITGGGSFVGVYGAIDTESNWAFYSNLLATRPTTHSPIAFASVLVEDDGHPATAELPHPWFRTDTWANFSPNPRHEAGVDVLLAMDENSYVGGNMMGDHPIAWTRALGTSRILYTGLGQTADSYTEPEFLSHLRGAILWALYRE